MFLFNRIFRPRNLINIPHRAIHLITSPNDFDTKIQSAGSKLVVVEFFANWCGICHLISPKFEVLSEKYASKMLALKVDVETFEEIAIRYDFIQLPTFVFFKNKVKIHTFTGSSEETLENLIKENTK